MSKIVTLTLICYEMKQQKLIHLRKMIKYINSYTSYIKNVTREHLCMWCKKNVTFSLQHVSHNTGNKKCYKYEPPHDKTNKVHVRPAKTQISLGIRPVWSVFAVRMKTDWVLSYPLSAQRRLWSDWADAQADLSLRWAHTHFVGFVTRRLI